MRELKNGSLMAALGFPTSKHTALTGRLKSEDELRKVSDNDG